MPNPLVVLLALLLTACGGGAHPVDVAVYGDSWTSAALLAVKPAQRMQAALGDGYAVHDYSVGGTSTLSALQGDPRQSFTTLPEHVRATRPAVTLILYGGNDTKDGGVDPQFESRLRQLVAASEGAGSRVVLATMLRVPGFDVVIEQIDQVIVRVASDMDCELADVHALPQGAFLDGVHPDQAYSDARAGVLTAAIERVTGS